jgi:hypothetical protein
MRSKTMLTEDERRAIVESGSVWTALGCRATLGGIKNPEYCTVTSAYPGFWRCSWDVAAAAVARPDRRFAMFDLSRGSGAWLGCLPAPRSDWQTEADYVAARERGDAE